ncbi:MAG: dimethylsulfonioproprionate lyase family protein [Granulosicoccus sp.]
MNDAIAQFLNSVCECFSNHDSDIAQQLCDSLSSLCDQSEADGVEPSRYPPRQVPACALLPDGASLSTQPYIQDLLACHQVLAWRHPGFGRLPPSLSDHLAVTELVGPDGMYAADNLRFGVLLQAGNVHYPVHQHAAEELYYVLHGTAGWGEHPNRLQRKPAGEFIHHRPFEPHCISTGSELLVALWTWAGEINSASYAVDSAQVH